MSGTDSAVAAESGFGARPAIGGQVAVAVCAVVRVAVRVSRPAARPRARCGALRRTEGRTVGVAGIPISAVAARVVSAGVPVSTAAGRVVSAGIGFRRRRPDCSRQDCGCPATRTRRRGARIAVPTARVIAAGITIAARAARVRRRGSRIAIPTGAGRVIATGIAIAACADRIRRRGCRIMRATGAGRDCNRRDCDCRPCRRVFGVRAPLPPGWLRPAGE